MTTPGNPFPITEHPFECDSVGNAICVKSDDGTMKRILEPNGYYGKPLRGGYQSHYTVGENLFEPGCASEFVSSLLFLFVCFVFVLFFVVNV